MSVKAIHISADLTQMGDAELEKLPSPKLPQEIWAEVAKHIDEDHDLAQFASVCTVFTLVVRSDQKLYLRRLGIYDYAFGKGKWEKFFGQIGEEPPFPDNIDQRLNSPCPIWPDKKIKQTHLLTLIPTHVNGKRLTLSSLRELVKQPNSSGNAAKLNDHRSLAAPMRRSTWVLMTRDVLPNSRSASCNEHYEQVENLSQKTDQPYKVPHLLEASVCILMEYVATSRTLYNDKPWTFTTCQEIVDNRFPFPYCIGGFKDGKLEICFNRGLSMPMFGVAAVQRL